MGQRMGGINRSIKRSLNLQAGKDVPMNGKASPTSQPSTAGGLINNRPPLVETPEQLVETPVLRAQMASSRMMSESVVTGERSQHLRRYRAS